MKRRKKRIFMSSVTIGLLLTLWILMRVEPRSGAAQPLTTETADAPEELAGQEINAPGLPDLLVTDVWHEGDTIWYQIRNVGPVTATAGHQSAVDMDGFSGKQDYINVELAPGERLTRQFSDNWMCTPLQDTITVCVDVLDEIDEIYETNNCREENWLCDTIPPQIITGPTVSDITTSTTVIAWETDEVGDSVVKYGKQANEYDKEVQDTGPMQSHLITLIDLEPGTAYYYAVQSTDASGNVGTSKKGVFETPLPEDGETPIISNFQVTQVGKEQYEFVAEASDASGVERIEFYLDDRLIGIDYTPTSPFRVPLAPSRLDMTREAFYAPHTASAVAIDRTGISDRLDNPFVPIDEGINISMGFEAPPQEYTLYTQSSTVPPNTFVDIHVYAMQSSWDLCYYDPIIGHEFCQPQDRENVAQVDFYVDGSLEYTSDTPETGYIHSYLWDADGLSVNTQHIISATVVTTDGAEHPVNPHRVINIVQGAPSIWVDRSVSRTDSYFTIELTVGNSGTMNATVNNIVDTLTGFQPVVETGSTAYRLQATYNPQTLQSTTIVDILPGRVLVPGESIDVTYLAVPFLHPDLDTQAYVIGAEDITIYYTDTIGFQTHTQALPCQATDGGEWLPEAVSMAQQASDYLIMTDPTDLFLFNGRYSSEVSTLLATMAELAQLKQGILAYVDNLPRASIENWIQQWGGSMKGSDGLENHYLSNGYLLIVGETEIVPAARARVSSWWYGSKIIRDTDAFYADTAGGAIDPELIVGRIIGENAVSLAKPLRASIRVHNGRPSAQFDRSHAFLVQGWSSCRSGGCASIDFRDEIGFARHALETQGTQNITYMATYSYLSATLAVDEFFARTPNQDIIHLAGHGSPSSWDDLNTWNFSHGGLDPFANANPFVYASSCLTGRYEPGYSLAEAFLDRGAGVYLGSTEVSYCCTNTSVAKQFYEAWSPGRSIGSALRQVKRAIGGYYADIWTAEYHLYGDPKYGAGVIPPAISAVTTSPTSPPQSMIEVTIPDYEIVTGETGEHHVSIPGGFFVLEPGNPLVPLYTVSLDYPIGYRVQGVTLTNRSGLSATTGLSITNFTPKEAGNGVRSPSTISEDTSWWPEESFDWQVSEMPDGSSILTLNLYPFYYNAQTTDVRFYKDYTFEIDYITSTVTIEDLTTDQRTYSQGDHVRIDTRLHNDGEPQDVFVSVSVKSESGSEIADSLPLQSLHDLAGDALYSAQWDSAGFAPGYYALEVEFMDAEGQELSKMTKYIRLGNSAGEITTFTAIPEHFKAGDAVSATLVFSNSGTIPITGTAIIQIQASSGEVVEQFEYNFQNLPTLTSQQFDATWDTSGSEADAYTLIGYVLYDSKATTPRSISISNRSRIYLPLVLRQ